MPCYILEPTAGEASEPHLSKMLSGEGIFNTVPFFAATSDAELPKTRDLSFKILNASGLIASESISSLIRSHISSTMPL